MNMGVRPQTSNRDFSDCPLCGQEDKLGLGVCLECSRGGETSQTLVYLRTSNPRTRSRAAAWVARLLPVNLSMLERREVLNGVRPLTGVTDAVARKVSSRLAEDAISTILVPYRFAATAVPGQLYATLALIMICGIWAGLTADPRFLLITPLFAVLLWLAALRLVSKPPALSRPAQDSQGWMARRTVVDTIVSLPRGTARRLLDRIVRSVGARDLPDPEVSRVISAACECAHLLATMDGYIEAHAGHDGNSVDADLTDRLRRCMQIRESMEGLMVRALDCLSNERDGSATQSAEALHAAVRDLQFHIDARAEVEALCSADLGSG